jgi:hypothetical protein
VAAEIRWAFAPPRAWLSGVAVNLALSLAWLLVEPVHAEEHRDWVILVGTYFRVVHPRRRHHDDVLGWITFGFSRAWMAAYRRRGYC